MNLAIDRDAIVKLLGGYAAPAKGAVPPGHPWWGNPKFDIKYDPNQAKKLLAEAGYSTAKPVKIKVQISQSGSGQMLPLPMNELIQQQLKEVGIEVEFDVLVWETLFNNWRLGSKDPKSNGAHAINVSFATQDPFFAFARFYDSRMVAPRSVNWGWIQDPQFDKLVAAARGSFEGTERDAALGRLHAYAVEQAPFLFVVHDTGPRAISKRVTGFVQAKNWFQDLTPIVMK